MRCSLLALSSYHDGELGPRRQGEVEAHLVACRRCSSGLERLQAESLHMAGLARIHVDDASAVELLGRLKLPTEAVRRRGDDPPGVPVTGGGPPGSNSGDGPAAPQIPPWLSGRVGAALPWRPRRPAGVRDMATTDDPEEGNDTVDLNGAAQIRSATDPLREAPL